MPPTTGPSALSDWMNRAELDAITLWTALVITLLTLACIAAGFAQEAFAKRRGLLIYAMPLGDGQLRHEAVGTLVFHVVFVPSAVIVWSKGLTFTSGWRADVTTFFACFVAFQVYYYVLHRAMHTKALYRFHKWHHRSRVMTPVAGLSMGPVEAVGWTVGLLGPALALSALGVLGAWGFVAFLAFHWYGNITGHANADFTPRALGTKLGSTFANPVTYHALHHARYQGHYGFGSAYMDRVGGTEFTDWQKVHERVMRGEPLHKMGELIE